MPNTQYSASSNNSYSEHRQGKGRFLSGFFFFPLVLSMLNDEMVFDKLTLKCLWEMQAEMSHLTRQMQKSVTII